MNFEINELKYIDILNKITLIFNNKAKLYLVGGTVREFFLNNYDSDLDLAISINPEIVKQILSSHNITSFDCGKRFGTIICVIDKVQIEITTFRKLNSKEFSNNIIDDLIARDFTINSLAYSLTENKIIDPLDGLKDLENKILKTSNDPNIIFKEDPLRILRMIRFGPAQNRTIEEKTLISAKNNVHLLKDVSVERIKSELEKLLLNDNIKEAFHLMKDLKILDLLIPEFIETFNFEQNEYHTEDVFEHLLSVTSNTKKDLTVRIAALFHDIGKPQSFSVGIDKRRHFFNHEYIGEKITRKILRRLKFSKKEINNTCLLIRYHMRPLDCGPAGIRRLIRDLGDQFDNWIELKKADKTPTMNEEEFNDRLNSFLELLTVEKQKQADKDFNTLAISGHDLINLGILEGKKIGIILNKLKEIVLDNPELNNKEQLLELVKNIKN